MKCWFVWFLFTKFKTTGTILTTINNPNKSTWGWCFKVQKCCTTVHVKCWIKWIDYHLWLVRPFWTSMLSRVCLTWTSGWPCEMQLVQNHSTSAMPVEVYQSTMRSWDVTRGKSSNYNLLVWSNEAMWFWKKVPGSSCRKWHLRDWWSDKSKSWRSLPCSAQAAKSTKFFGDSDGYQILLESTHSLEVVFLRRSRFSEFVFNSKWIHRKSSLAQVCLDGFQGAETVSSTERMSRNATLPWHLGTVCRWINRISDHYQYGYTPQESNTSSTTYP